MKKYLFFLTLFVYFNAIPHTAIQAQPKTFIPKGTQSSSTTTPKKSEPIATKKTSKKSFNPFKSKSSKKTIATPEVTKLLSLAERHIGVPYKWGGSTTKGFDCSGYVQYVYKDAGLRLKRVSKDQANEGKKVSVRKAQKGDLVFFGEKKRKITHVGLVVSGKKEPLKMIHASSSKGVIITDVSTSSYWLPKLQKVRRVLNKHELKMVNAKSEGQLRRATRRYLKKYS